MIKSVVLCLAVGIFLSCRNNNIPEGVLPPAKMEAVLWDLIRADQVLNIQYSTDTTVNHTLKSRQLYKQVLVLHKITEDEFKKSFGFYGTHPDALKTVLDSLRKKPAQYIPASQPQVK